MREEVFISYAWPKRSEQDKKYEKILTTLTNRLKEDFKVIIDKQNVNYKDNIKEFENRLASGQKIVLVISDRFLKSPHCMYEIMRIRENENTYNRIFPVVLKDAKIYNSSEAIIYIQYWENEIEKLNTKLNSLNSKANIPTIQSDLNNYTQFRAIMDDFRGLLSNMNTLSPEIHVESNFEALVLALNDNKPIRDKKSEKDFVQQIVLTKDLFEKAITIIEQEVKAGSKNAESILKNIRHFYQQCEDQTFQIAVMAMVKSGKSTFLNSILGNEFLPMNNVPETSVPVKIVHSKKEDGVLSFNDSEISGARKIKNYLETINKEKREQGLMHETQFSLEASFVALEEEEMTDIKFEIIDSPGFGEAIIELTVGNDINQSITELIDKTSAVIYILDYTKLKTKDENQALTKLVEMRSDILDKIQDRLFFVINQIDEEDRNSLPPEKAIDYVYNLMKDKMPNVKKQHFFTISAKHALLSRLILKNNATDGAKSDFGKIAFGFRATKVLDSDYKQAANEILKTSKIEEVEDSILRHVFDNRSRIFIESLQDNLKRLLNEFKNKFVVTAAGTLNKTVKEIESLEAKIEDAKKKQQNIQEEADNFDEEMKNWIESEFKKFEKSILDHIESAFNIDKAEEKQSFFGNMLPSWVKKLQGYIQSAEEQSMYSSIEDIEEIIKQLNQIISEELSTSFAVFKKNLESMVLNKQGILFEKLKKTINEIARDFETTLKKELQIELEPVELQIESINPQKMLSNAETFIDRFVKSNSRIRYVRHEYQVYVKGSWCERDRYEKRYKTQPEWFTENNINKNGIELHWKKEIEMYNTNAKRVTNHLVEQNIKSQIKKARDSFSSYVNDYMATIQEQKIKLTSSSKEEIEYRLQALQEQEDSITSILKRLC